MARLIMTSIAAAAALFFFVPCCSQAATGDVTVLVFGNSRCEPCQQMAPFINRLAEEGWNVRRIDTDQEAQLISRFSLKSVPTTVILKGNDEVDRIVGAVGYEQLRKRFESAAAKGSAAPKLLDSPAASQFATNSQGPSASAPTVRGQSPVAALGSLPMLSSAGSQVAGAARGASQWAASTSGSGSSLRGDLSNGSDAVRLGSIDRSPSPNRLGASEASYDRTPRGESARSAEASVEVIRRAENATVRIRIEESNTVACGTGTIIHVRDNEALILTCGHMFRDMSPTAKITVDIYRNGVPTTVPAQVVDFQAEELDIGLMSFRLPFAVEPVPLAPIAEGLQVGQVAFSFGCDRGADPSRRDTKVKRLNRFLGAPNIEIFGAPVLGRSGGGLFDGQGRLIGVCNAADEEDDEGIYAGQGVIRTQLERLGMVELIDRPSPTGTAAAGASFASAAISPDRTVNEPRPIAELASTPRGNVPRWPDEMNRSPKSIQDFGSVEPATSGRSDAFAARSPKQITCIVREADGSQRVIELTDPSPELLQALERQSQVNRTAMASNAAPLH